MDFKIRRAKLTDLKQIQDLNYKLFLYDAKLDPELFSRWPYSKKGKEYFIKSIKNTQRACPLVAVINNQIIGYLIGWILIRQSYRPVKTAEIENMFILGKYRRQGIGNALVNRFIRWCKNKDVKSIVVWSYNKNKKAHTFYQKCDLKPLSTRFELKP